VGRPGFASGSSTAGDWAVAGWEMIVRKKNEIAEASLRRLGINGTGNQKRALLPFDGARLSRAVN
jgi:hypothetical protein